jgi:hypothetical protein
MIIPFMALILLCELVWALDRAYGDVSTRTGTFLVTISDPSLIHFCPK